MGVRRFIAFFFNVFLKYRPTTGGLSIDDHNSNKLHSLSIDDHNYNKFHSLSIDDLNYNKLHSPSIDDHNYNKLHSLLLSLFFLISLAWLNS
ncbi:hypothetical protein HanPSC8_Chr08g0314801 [Helianthus annuus]|nr:hypothetical protein HanPSC8_Chr08g0314801 [Helianthus annuus]